MVSRKILIIMKFNELFKKLEKACTNTVEDGFMTKDLAIFLWDESKLDGN